MQTFLPVVNYGTEIRVLFDGIQGNSGRRNPPVTEHRGMAIYSAEVMAIFSGVMGSSLCHTPVAR